MTLLREVIDIPERIHRGDFVLRLTEGVDDADRALRDYVVTPSLVGAFTRALGLIRSAVEAGTSKAAYLHSSFGGGKSHFMAVLHHVLAGAPAARAKTDLAPVIVEADQWLSGRRFLMVPYHMIGAESMESAILGGYVQHVRRRHPDAPLPAVYPAKRLFDDAVALRSRMGDEAFFAGLNETADSGGDWGDLGAVWDASSFEAAVAAGPATPDADRLLAALVASHFRAFEDMANAGNLFVSLDQGLAVISAHAKSLGYDALVLFLDELVLWLASRIADAAFVNREGPKLAKLVESGDANRPVPIVSFIARQRDLRELVGEHVPGAEHLAFHDMLKYWEDRFDLIVLEDRNLPAIASQRILAPRDAAAKAQIDEAFARTERVRKEVWDRLLGDDGDRESFRLTYPFSPAFVKTLVALSSVLQRERTALRVMLQLLVEHRDELELGDLVPLGDLFTVLSEGDEPFSQEMKRAFDQARSLYETKFRPLLLEEHHLTDEQAATAPTPAFRADDLIVKTLLLAALAPEAQPLRGLDADQLTVLNHGTITAPIPGQERTLVLTKLQRWGSRIGELRLGTGANPTVSVQLSGVDTRLITENARSADNDGARRKLLRRLVFESMGITAEDLFTTHTLAWRGTKRTVEVRFGNVRDREELPESKLRASGTTWLVVIDFPFDDGHTPADDIRRIEELRAGGIATQTVCWVPAFFTAQSLARLGELVVLDHVLAGERFESYASHLSALQKAEARQLLESQRSALTQSLRLAIDQAYGVRVAEGDAIEPGHDIDQQLQSLLPSFTPQPPAGADLAAAFEHVCGQAFAHQFPAHPQFEEELRPGHYRTTLETVRRAMATPDGRIPVDRNDRSAVRLVANPLKLGEMHEQAFVLRDDWRVTFERQMAALPEGEPVTVGRLRAWIDEPVPMGLPREAANLVIIAFAERTGRSFTLHGGPATATIERLDDEWELHTQELPDQATWERAVDVAGRVFGVVGSPLRSVASVSELAANVLLRTADHEASNVLIARLEDACRRLGTDGGARLQTARAQQELLSALRLPKADVVEVLAAVTPPTSLEALGRSLATAEEVSRAVGGTNWELIAGALALTDERAPRAQVLRTDLVAAVEADELTTPLGETLRRAEEAATALVVTAASAHAGSAATGATRPAPGRVRSEGSCAALPQREALELVDELRAELAADDEARLTITWRIEAPPGEET